MAYVSLYRKYRSQTFSDLMGQDHVVKTLQNGIATGKIAHSYLFTGPRGTGKTSTARLLAKALCCEHGPSAEPDNTCHICQSITTGSCVDVVEMDAASESGVEDIREQIVEAVEYRPMVCRYKVFIIDEVHDLSSKAFDALLKTVEEPPPHIIFVLATTEYNKVPPTIRSRCQKHEFRRASLEDLINRLDYVLEHEEVKADPAAVAAIARMADGGYRDALTLLEQAMLVSDGHITLEKVYDQLGLVAEEAIDGLFQAIGRKDVPDLIVKLEEITRQGKDSRAILESMMYRLADLTRASYQVYDRSLDAARDASLHERAVLLGRDLILRLRTEVAEAHKLIRDISLPRIWLESRLVGLATQEEKPSSLQVASSKPQTTPAPPPKREAPTLAPAEKIEPAIPAELEPQADVGEQPLTGETVLDEAIAAWNRTQVGLGKLSATLSMRLKLATVSGRSGHVVTIQLERITDHDWILEGKKRPSEAILKEFRQQFNPDAEIKYTVKKKDPSTGINDEDKAVELPLEGRELDQKVKQLFV